MAASSAAAHLERDRVGTLAGLVIGDAKRIARDMLLHQIDATLADSTPSASASGRISEGELEVHGSQSSSLRATCCSQPRKSVRRSSISDFHTRGIAGASSPDTSRPRDRDGVGAAQALPPAAHRSPEAMPTAADPETARTGPRETARRACADPLFQRLGFVARPQPVDSVQREL